jgi:hypothetical protein
MVALGIEQIYSAITVGKQLSDVSPYYKFQSTVIERAECCRQQVLTESMEGSLRQFRLFGELLLSRTSGQFCG